MTQKKNPHLKIVKPPEDLEEIKKQTGRLRREKVRRILVMAVIIILAVCGTYLLLKNQSYGQARLATEYKNDISDSNNYASFAGGFIRYSRDGVVFLNKKNEEQWIQPVQLQNPIIEVRDEAFAVADNGGNSIFVFTEDGLKGEIETTLPIEKITVSNQGIVSAILKNENSPRIMSYDATGNILVEQQITMNTLGYPTALELSDDGTILAVSYLYTQGTSLKSRVIYYNFGETGQEETDNKVTTDIYDNTVMADIFFMGNNRSVVIGDNCFAIYRGSDIPEKVSEVQIGQEIRSVFHSDRYIGFILLNRDKSGYELRLYNRSGNQILNREIDGDYSNVKIDGDEIIMYDGSNCCIVTITGILKYKGDLDVEILEMSRAAGLNRYYVMSVDELRVIYLTK